MNETLSYDDVTLRPLYSDIASRDEVDTSVSLFEFRFGLSLRIPIVSAAMDTVTGCEMSVAMWNAGGLGALHRFWTIEENVEAYSGVRARGADCLVTVGARDWDQRSSALFEAGARTFLVDIAHGHSSAMRDVLTGLRSRYGRDIAIIAGNIATAEAVRDLAGWGADAVKCGVGPGAACSTRVVTGHGVPMFSCVLECAAAADVADVLLVADGGIRSSGDIVKAIVAGADIVMVGSLLAPSREAPGERMIDPATGRRLKNFRGMATNGARCAVGMPVTSAPEGVEMFVEEGPPAAYVLDELAAGLRSGMSYSGARDLKKLRGRGNWIRQTSAGLIEGRPRFSTV